MVLMALFTVTGTFAKTGQNPKGLYRLQSFIYEDGGKRTPGFLQYKYAADSVGLLISYRPSATMNQWGNMTVEIREPYPLLFTGEKPQGEDGHGTQVFNVDDRQFYFKWYNSRWPNMSKLNEFITEVYTKDDIQEEVSRSFDLLENKVDSREQGAGIRQGDKFYGWWIRVAAAANPDGTGKRQQVPTIWKAYSPQLSMVVSILNDGNVLGCNPTSTIKYESDSTIYEIGHLCNIHWINDNCHALTFVQENGRPLTEIWVRAGLPNQWQKVFGTSLETYRNGVDCIREAVEASVGGNLNKAETLIDEAINDKDVPIQVLGEGVAAIASHLLVNQQKYKDCVAFCERQLKKINDYADAGHDYNMLSQLHVHMTEVFKAVATFRSGDTVKGKMLMEGRVSIVEGEIEKYRTVRSMEPYINMLYYCNLMMYSLGYEVFGSERTLLYLDVLNLMAPSVVSNNKPIILKCRANCALQNGNKEEAEKLFQQAKELEQK